MEFIIKNAGIRHENYYLKEVKQDVMRISNPVSYGMPKNRGRKWKCVETRKEENPKGGMTSVWVKDETQAKYFQSRKEAEQMIEDWGVLRNAIIVEA